MMDAMGCAVEEGEVRSASDERDLRFSWHLTWHLARSKFGSRVSRNKIISSYYPPPPQPTTDNRQPPLALVSTHHLLVATYTYIEDPPSPFDSNNLYINMLWVDKHRPKDLSQLDHHPSTTARLQSLAADPASLPHLLFYGPSGAGKKTRIACLLKAIFGNGADRLRLDKRTFKTSTNKSVDINMICSNYHIELNPGDAGIYDRFVVQDVIKEMAANKSLNSGGGIMGTVVDDAKKKKGGVEYKVVVLVEVDKLTRQAQAALRRTMEKYSSTCRLILCCNNQSKVIEPVRSRCLGIRIAAPSHDDVSSESAFDVKIT